MNHVNLQVKLSDFKLKILQDKKKKMIKELREKLRNKNKIDVKEEDE